MAIRRTAGTPALHPPCVAASTRIRPDANRHEHRTIPLEAWCDPPECLTPLSLLLVLACPEECLSPSCMCCKGVLPRRLYPEDVRLESERINKLECQISSDVSGWTDIVAHIWCYAVWERMDIGRQCDLHKPWWNAEKCGCVCEHTGLGTRRAGDLMRGTLAAAAYWGCIWYWRRLEIGAQPHRPGSFSIKRLH